MKAFKKRAIMSNNNSKPNNQFSSLEDFLKNSQQSNDKLDFSKSDYKSVYNYSDYLEDSSKNTNDNFKVEYTNSQLALIGRALYQNSTDSGTGDLNYESPLLWDKTIQP